MPLAAAGSGMPTEDTAACSAFYMQKKQGKLLRFARLVYYNNSVKSTENLF